MLPEQWQSLPSSSFVCFCDLLAKLTFGVFRGTEGKGTRTVAEYILRRMSAVFWTMRTQSSVVYSELKLNVNSSLFPDRRATFKGGTAEF